MVFLRKFLKAIRKPRTQLHENSKVPNELRSILPHIISALIKFPALHCAFHARGLSHLYHMGCEIFNQYQDHIGLQNLTAFSDGAVKIKNRWSYQTASLTESLFPIKGKDLCSCLNQSFMVIINICRSCYIFSFSFIEKNHTFCRLDLDNIRDN